MPQVLLIDESQNLYSRKDMFPELMDAAFRAFAPGDDEQAFWREYGFYWLSGKSLAAEDWRKKFFEKGRELAAQGVPVLPEQSGLSWEAYEHLKFDFLLQSPRRRNLEAMEIDAPADERGRLRFLLDRLHGLGFEPVVINLTTDELRELGIWVVRAVIPVLMPMSSVQRGRFLGTPRLYDYPCRGLRRTGRAPDQPNPATLRLMRKGRGKGKLVTQAAGVNASRKRRSASSSSPDAQASSPTVPR